MPLNYVTGDLFDKITTNIVIPHVCNNLGVWGSGFVIPLGKRFPEAKFHYKGWFEKRETSEYLIPFELGRTQFVEVASGIHVANMVAQLGVQTPTNFKPIKYLHLANCMQQVGQMARLYNYKIICPLFGSGLAGGDWDFIEELIKELWSHTVGNSPLDVTVYQLEGQELRPSGEKNG